MLVDCKASSKSSLTSLGGGDLLFGLKLLAHDAMRNLQGPKARQVLKSAGGTARVVLGELSVPNLFALTRQEGLHDGAE